MSVLLSGRHPFPLDAVAVNSFDHFVSVANLVTPTGVPYAVLTYTPRNTPGFDYDQFFTYSGPAVFTVSFDATAAQARNQFLLNGAPDLTGELTNPRALSAAEIVNARAALAEYSMFANITFTEVSGGAAIMFFHDERFGRTGFARNSYDVNWSAGGAYTISDVTGFAAIGASNDPFMFVHELGHVLTLKHVGPIQTDSETPFLPAQYRDNKYSIMFYDVTNAAVIDPGERFTRHLQLFDVYALQQRFGANLNWRTGDDVYDAASFDGWRQVLWDAGGEDTFDFSAQSANQYFDLREGSFSTLGGFLASSTPDSLSIAYGAIIENAIGGAGDDTLIGNAATNELSGNDGDDFAKGGDGADLLSGGAGNDALNGEVGDDTIGGASGSDNIDGGKGRDYLLGGGGEDMIVGGDGNDTIFGGFLNDTIAGGAGYDYASGDDGHDLLLGGDFADTLVGGNGSDFLNGGIDNDRLLGEAQHDTIFGDPGDDIIDAGTGNDMVDGGTQRDSVFGGSGFDLIDGGGGNDTLTGGTDGDTISGGAGFDVLQGDAGDDVLNGGASNDVIFGNAGNDTIVLNLGGGTDTLRDFTAGAASEDVISLTGFGAAFDTFAEVIGAATQTGAHVTIDFGNGDTLIIRNTLVAALHADDFSFG